MVDIFNFFWTQMGNFVNLLRVNLSFDMGLYTVSFFDIIIVLMLFYLIMKFFIFRH